MVRLRGKQLLKVLNDTIKQLSEKAKSKNVTYTFNASELQRITGISRVTIAKYEEEIDEILEDVKASSRVQYGQAHMQALYDQIDNLNKDIKEFEKENKALRNHHIEIYQRLYSYSADLSGLIKPEIITENEEIGKCILCGIKNGKKKIKNNVIQLNKTKK